MSVRVEKKGVAGETSNDRPEVTNGIEDTSFITPEEYAEEQRRALISSRGRLILVGCNSGNYMAKKVKDAYQSLSAETGSDAIVPLLSNVGDRFEDTETNVNIEEHVGGADVFVFQALRDPTSNRSVNDNYMELFTAARALRENGASHVTAVLPYLAYARQDKPTPFMRQAVTARLMADFTEEAGVDRVVTWDPHSDQIRGFYSIPINMLQSLSFFIDKFRWAKDKPDVVAVAPDAGAAKFIMAFAEALNISYAIANKYRPKPDVAEVTAISGDFTSKTTAIVVDDMLSTGGTLLSLMKKMCEEFGISNIFGGVSHNLLNGQAIEKLLEMHEKYNLREFYVTNSIPQTGAVRAKLPFVRESCLGDNLARVVNRIHYDRSVSKVFYRPKRDAA